MSKDGFASRQWRLFVIAFTSSLLFHIIIVLFVPFRGAPWIRTGAPPTLTVHLVAVPVRQETNDADAGANPSRQRSPQPPVTKRSPRKTGSGNGERRVSSPKPSEIVESTPARPPLKDWRDAVNDSVRASSTAAQGSSAEQAVIRQSSVAAASDRQTPDVIAQAFERALGNGWRAAGQVSSEVRADGTRVERIQTPSGAYCVRISGRVASFDPFGKQDQPLVAVRC